MAEEKKKRFRPSLGAYRALENEVSELREKNKRLENRLSEQIDGSSSLVHDCDLWRDKYQELFASHEAMKSSNGYLEGEVDRLREVNKSLEDENERLRFEMRQMEKRGFWSRVFNTK